MLKEERHNIILTEIKTHRRVYSTALSKLLDVSEDTVRRDLHELARTGHVRKVHGGAMVNNNGNHLLEQKSFSPEDTGRMRIAEKASQCVLPNSVILMDGGLINLKVVEFLPTDFAATIFTNSLQVATKLTDYPQMETILLGGRLSHLHRITTGMDVIQSLAEIHADLCLMEVTSVHDEVGLSENDKDIANTKKAMIRSSSQVTAMCTYDHIGTMQPFRVCPINAVHSIITESEPKGNGLESLASKGVRIL
ncbi:MAG: DeoR/GlpR family DNA-binding transcription regulator [Bacteroidota bacterium]